MNKMKIEIFTLIFIYSIWHNLS